MSVDMTALVKTALAGELEHLLKELRSLLLAASVTFLLLVALLIAAAGGGQHEGDQHAAHGNLERRGGAAPAEIATS